MSKPTLLFLITLTLLALLTTSNEQPNTEEAEMNYIHHFNLEAVPDFLKERKYVVMYLTEPCNAKSCIERDVKFRKTSLEFIKEEILFIRIPVNSIENASNIMATDMASLPHFAMSFFGWKKTFDGENLKHLTVWIHEIFDAMPSKIDSFKDIRASDEHFYVYFDKNSIEVEDFDVLMLSKMIHPISMYYGANPELPDNKEHQEFQEIMRWRQTDTFLFAVREYDHFLEPLNHTESVSVLSKKIISAEFPDQCKLDLKTTSYILHHRMPTVVYFDYQPSKQPFYSEFRELYRSYRNYLLFCTLDLAMVEKSQNPKLVFYANYLAGGIPRRSKKGFIRVVNYENDFQRYKVYGKLSRATGHFLIQNFLHGNIQKFRASEKLGDKNFITLKSGLRKINKAKWDEILTHKMTTHLVYIYSSMSQDTDAHFKVLLDLSRAIEKNNRFSISLFDHDRNDLDGHLHEDLPILLLSNKVFERRKFEGEISFRGVIAFLAENVSWLKLNEEFLPELRDVHGIDLIQEDL